MPANNAPIFGLTPIHEVVHISAANTNRDGTGTIVDSSAAGSSGRMIEKIRLKASATTTAGMIRIFHKSGSTYRLWREVSVPAVVPSGTVPAWEFELVRADDYLMARLPSGVILGFSTNNAEAFECHIEGMEY